MAYLSIVVAARNDTYGGNFLQRMQLFLDWLFLLWQKYNLDAELVIVEWNPLPERPRMKDALAWPKALKPGAVRIIEVSPELHNQLPGSDKMPMFEYIAKNVGVRRAHGEYILATNTDIIFSESLVKFLASRKLSPRCFYRTDRYDVDLRAIPLEDIRDLEILCRRHWARVCGHMFTFEKDKHRSYLAYRLWRLFVRPIIHPRDNVKDVLWLISDRHRIFKRFLAPHCNAPGDFFLMGRSHWNTLRGYPEAKTFTMVDTYLCFAAASSGLHQVILKGPMRIYHLEHGRQEQLQRLNELNWPELEKRCYKMLRSRTPEIFNEEHWGMAREQLSEQVIF